MRLRSLELLPRGDAGWTSGSLPFGRATTLLLGPNGAGKTPLLKALCYALGHPVELPPLIREKCSAVSVDLIADEAEFRIVRQLEAGVMVTVTDKAGNVLTFTDERELSAWVLPKLGVALRTLSSGNGDQVPPYISVAGPMFLVDQDTGWASVYVPFETHKFVRDQREEVVRWLLDLPAKHRPIDKTEYKEAKTEQAGIQEQIAFKRRGLETLKRELGEDRARDAAERLQERKATLEAAIKGAQSVLQTMLQAESSLDVRVREAGQQRDEIARKLSNARRRKKQLADYRSEIGAEIGALEQNEVAADVFRKLCGNEACGFFRNEDSFGRRVLYLKDQLKDFEASTGETERTLAVLTEQLAAADRLVTEATETKKKELEERGGGETISLINSSTRELSEVGVRLDRLERIAREQKQLDALINKEARAKEAVDELRPTAGARKDTSRILDARQHLVDTFKDWLLALRTPNVPAEVEFDEELRLVVSGEKFSSKSSHSGSTRTRIVLAYHAAMVETSLRMNGKHPRLLVLDAPRQHELSAEDLRAYIARFHKMSSKLEEPVQLVFSATDPEVVPKDSIDKVWEPPFDFDGEPRFLGAPPPSEKTP